MHRSALVCAVVFLTGHALLLPWPELPPYALLACLLAAVVAGLRRWPVLSLLLAGFASLWVDARATIEDRLDRRLAGRDLEIRAQVVDFPDLRGVPRYVVRPVGRSDLPSRLRLSWYGDTGMPELGECWRMTVRLRRPRGFLNPGRFDYERWLFTQRYGATGYVRAARPDPTCAPRVDLAQLRRALAERLRSTLPDDRATAVLLAVTLGARQWLSREQWQAFSVTGTSHLMAISGMHVALASGGFYLLLRLLLGAVGWRYNQIALASVGASGFAAAYAALSGFAVPAQRAVMMLLIVVAAVLLRRAVSPWHLLGLTAFVVALVSPLDVMTPGFQLSFLAVALLMLMSAGLGSPRMLTGSPEQRAWRFLRDLSKLQVLLLLGLLPLTVAYFGRAAWVSPLVNLLVVPIFNLVCLPAALAGVLIDNGAGDILLLSAWRGVRLIGSVIAFGAALPSADIAMPATRGAAALALLMAAVAAALPAGWPGRSIAWLAIATMLLPEPPARPPVGCVDIDVLDVGQGLAVVLRTRRHAAVYDTGPAFRSGGDTGELVVVPFLRYVGSTRLDLAVISHADLDHAGGLASVAAAVPVSTILAGEPRETGAADQAIRCAAGQLWFWDAIRFRVLHPPGDTPSGGNNASCVLEVAAGNTRVLLTGDIESAVERRLLRDDLLEPAELVVIPHHGSKTSSHASFANALSAKVAVASAGHANRWGMPVAEVVERWRANGSVVLTTADDGALGYRVCGGAEPELLYRRRIDTRRFWNER